MVSTAEGDALEPTKFNLIDLMIVFARHKKLIVGLPIVVGLVVLAASFALPNEYRASAKLLPPQQAQSGAAMLLSQLGGAASIAAAGAGLKSPNDVYLGMLKSRTVADKLIQRFDLMKVYATPSMEKTRAMLEADSVIGTGKDGLIAIDVEGENQHLVAQIANGYVDELMKLTKVLAVTEAAQRRLFFERQLEQTKDKLAGAEVALKGALDTHGVISVEGESRAIVETVGRVRAQVSAKEIQLNSMRAFVTPNNQEFKRLQEELNSLRSELSKLENGRPALATDGPATAAKQSGLQNIRILRDVKYYEMLYELLTKQYELARLDEAKENSVIQLLDAAIEPERKSKPRRLIILIVAWLLTLFATVALVFLMEAKKHLTRTAAGAEQWAALRASLRLR